MYKKVFTASDFVTMKQAYVVSQSTIDTIENVQCVK